MLAHLRSHLHRNTGSTLIEVLIATTVVVLVLVAIVSTMTLVQRNQRASTSAQRATKYAQQPIEWMRQLRDTVGWKTFYDTVNSQGANVTHCLPVIPANVDTTAYLALPTTVCGSGVNHVAYDTTPTNTDDALFQRQLTTTVVTPEQIRLTVRVSWFDGPRTLYASSSAILQKWR